MDIFQNVRNKREFVDYDIYMQSEEWDARRRQRLKIDDYTCQDCRATDRPLDVHHLTYDNLGYEPMGDLISVCRQCHKRRHKEGVIEFNFCRTCSELLLIIKYWLPDKWTRWICSDGHINEKRGWK